MCPCVQWVCAQWVCLCVGGGLGPASVLQVCRCDLPEQTVSTSTERQTDTDLGQRRVQLGGQIEETIQKCRNSKGFADLS